MSRKTVVSDSFSAFLVRERNFPFGLMKGRHAKNLYEAMLKYDNHHIIKGQLHSLVHQPAEYNILPSSLSSSIFFLPLLCCSENKGRMS